MESLQKANLRIRRPFTHDSDSDSDSDSLPAALDEQEQEALIQSLARQNNARNAQFRLFLLALPVVSAIPYLVALPQAYGADSAGTGARIRALLSLTSLAATAWMLWALPPGVTGIRGIDGWISRGSENASKRRSHLGMGNTSAPFWAESRRDSPLATYLPYLNIALCVVLILAGLVSKPGASTREQPQQWGHIGLGNLPAIVYAVVVVVKIVMGGVDPERDLGALRYEYKGA
ncbi:hypothetical protein F4811DRAFT_385646 [Daldinia bambusicola]|nr:hypothetical protein F4811DRAFT_385646 [Daldinia bambusicola]